MPRLLFVLYCAISSLCEARTSPLTIKAHASSQSVQTYSSHAVEYDSWFDSELFKPIYLAEWNCVKAALLDFFGPEECFTLLEIGIGSGRFAVPAQQAFPKCTMFGIEPAEGMAAICADSFKRINSEVDIRKIPAEALDPSTFGDTKMDCILFVTVLGFLGDHDKVIENIKSVMSPRGRVVVAFINGKTPWGGQLCKLTENDKFYAHGSCVLDAQEIEDLFMRHGFKKTTSGSYQTLIGPPDALAALDFGDVVSNKGESLRILPGLGMGMWAVLAFEEVK